MKEKLLKILQALGLVEKSTKKELTNEDWKNIAASYKKTYGTDLNADIEAEKDGAIELDAETIASIEEILAENEPDDDSDDSGDDDSNDPSGSVKQPVVTAKTVKKIVEKSKQQKEAIKKLSGEPEDGKSRTTKVDANAILPRVLGKSGHTEKYLFGIEDNFYARNKWYNDIMLTKTINKSGKFSPEEKHEFREAFTGFVEGLQKRIEHLEANNLLANINFSDLIKGEGHIDYSDLTGTAGEYIVRRSDLIIAYLRSLPSVSSIFPLISNIQNKEIAPGANFGELSQGYRSGKIFKGNVAFTGEIYSVVDLMFKFVFSDMIKIEKQYIGYLNREGSDVIKWSFIEWVIVHFSSILESERNRRRVVGVRVPQQVVTANPAMLGADGALRAIQRVEEELKVLPFEDLKVYTDQTILEYLESFYAKVEEILPNMDGIKLYINAKHKRWYLAQYREKYGKDGDFSANDGRLVDSLTPENIVWYPNADPTIYKVWMTYPGNVENYEDKPNEMSMFYFERDFEDVLVLSRWKEGSGLQMAGVKYATKVLLEESGRTNQWIFTNYPASVVVADAVKVNGKLNDLFLTSANTVDTAITDIENANPEKVYKIVCGDLTKASTITKAAKFAKISDDWEPGAVGDYIKLYCELADENVIIDGETVVVTKPTGNFLELERKVTA